MRHGPATRTPCFTPAARAPCGEPRRAVARRATPFVAHAARAHRRAERIHDLRDVGGVPDVRPRRIAGETAVDRAVARTIIGDAAGRVEVDGRERTHERPAQPETVRERLVHVLRRHVALAHQAHRLVEQRALQPVEDEAVDLPLDDDRDLPDIRHHGVCALDGRGRSPRRAAKLDDRHEMGRIDGMGNQATRAAAQRLRELGCRDRRRGARKHRPRGRRGVERAEDLALHVEVFRQVLLNPRGAGHGILEAGRGRDAQSGSPRVVDEAGARKIRQAGRDEATRTVHLSRHAVEHAHMPAGAGEHRRPRTADQPTPDDGGGFRHEGPFPRGRWPRHASAHYRRGRASRAIGERSLLPARIHASASGGPRGRSHTQVESDEFASPYVAEDHGYEIVLTALREHDARSWEFPIQVAHFRPGEEPAGLDRLQLRSDVVEIVLA